MPPTLRKLLLLIIVIMSPSLARAQQAQEVTIEEPAIIDLEDLFKDADTVALVRIVSGDTENYNIAVYKGVVVEGFKGSATGETLYHGPYIGERLGWEYILFLRKVTKPIAPKSVSNLNYGTIHYSEVFSKGLTMMLTDYKCIFDEKKPSAEHCDYGVRVCTDFIKLPKSMPTFPPLMDDTPDDCRWVRKKAFMSLLEKFSKSKK